MTAPETIWAVNGNLSRMSEVGIDSDDIEYTRTDLCIRRDDPVLVQVMEALELLYDNVVQAWPTLANLGPVVNARAAIAAMQKLIGDSK